MGGAAIWLPIDSAPAHRKILVRDLDGDIYLASYEPDLDDAKIWSAYCGQPVVRSPEPFDWSPELTEMIEQSIAPRAWS